MECPHPDDVGTKEYLNRFRGKMRSRRVPLSGNIDLTHRCNLKCVHCYVASSAGNEELQRGEMSLSDVTRMIDEIVDAGCLLLLLTGGEPLLREDFSEIYKYAKRKGMLVTVFTNGTLVTNRLADSFREYPPRCVEVTVYGATETTYERITGVKGSFRKCISGIERMLDRGTNVRLKTILMTLNRHEFSDMKKMAEGYGVKFHFDACIFPRLDGDKRPLSLRVTAREAVEKEFVDPERKGQWIELMERTGGGGISENLYLCGAGVTGFHIDPYGRLQPCMMLPWISYDLNAGNFADGWKAIVSEVGNAQVTEEFVCRECDMKNLCGYCPGFFKLETGLETKPSQFLCDVGSIRAGMLGLNSGRGGMHARAIGKEAATVVQ